MKTFKNIMGYVVPIVVGLLIALLIKQYWFTLVRVDGTSMDPNLYDTEQVFVMRSESIHRGSVIVFDAFGENPEETSTKNYVKRVIAVAGDKLSAKNGVLKVNGKTIDQSYISKSEQKATNEINNVGNWNNLSELAKRQGWQKNENTIVVPKGKYFVLGDHRSVSNDSRYWGFVDKSKVMGVVKVGFWTNKTQQININDQWQTFFAK